MLLKLLKVLLLLFLNLNLQKLDKVIEVTESAKPLKKQKTDLVVQAEVEHIEALEFDNVWYNEVPKDEGEEET